MYLICEDQASALICSSNPCISYIEKYEFFYVRAFQGKPTCCKCRFANLNMYGLKFLVSKETVVLRRWERSKQKFGFIKRVDKGEITTVKDLES